MHGKIHWLVGDTTSPPGPQIAPSGLWDAPSGATPGAGNYIYLHSEAGDYIGQGQTFVYSPMNATVSLTGTGRYAQFNINTSSGAWWTGEFESMNGIPQLTSGYYGDLRRYPFHNHVKGGFDVFGFSRGCNTLTGWFMVDNISYVNGSLASLDLRFEQHCEGLAPALRGKIHWVN